MRYEKSKRRKCSKVGKTICSTVLGALLLLGMLPGSESLVQAAPTEDDPWNYAGQFCIFVTEDDKGIIISGDWGPDDDDATKESADIAAWEAIWGERNVNTSFVNDDMDDLGQVACAKCPYWKNDADHAGKLVPGTSTDYNLKWENDKLYLKNLKLTVNGRNDKGRVESAIYAEELFEVVLEGDNTITTENNIAIDAREGITFSGDGDLTIQATGEDFAAILSGGAVIHNGTGEITLDSAGPADGVWWDESMSEADKQLKGTGTWVDLSVPQGDPWNYMGNFSICIADNYKGIIIQSDDPENTVMNDKVWEMLWGERNVNTSFVEDILNEGSGAVECAKCPYWKNDPDHEGKLVPATASDYNLKYENGKLYLKGLKLAVNGGNDECNAIYAENALEMVIEADSTIVSEGSQAIQAAKGLTFSGSGNLRVETKADGELAAILSNGKVTHNGTGTITLKSAGGADGIWWEENTPKANKVVEGTGKWAGSSLPPESTTTATEATTATTSTAAPTTTSTAAPTTTSTAAPATASTAAPAAANAPKAATPATGDSGTPYMVLFLFLLSGAGYMAATAVMKSKRK